MPAEPTESELGRLAALDALGLDPFEATAFDDLTRLAAEVLETPMASIALVDRDGGHLKAKVGFTRTNPGPDRTLAALVLRHPSGVMALDDAALDERLRNELFSPEAPRIRFYAAAPLTLSTGDAIGALCVMDTVPRTIAADKLEQLKFLADQVIQTLEERQRSKSI